MDLTIEDGGRVKSLNIKLAELNNKLNILKKENSLLKGKINNQN